MRPTPVFLHSGWRTGSTYVWSKFRARPDTCCFFEPLNEHLADATPAFVDAFAPWAYANHPHLAAPYLEEFRPLLAPGGGVPGFPAELGYGRFRCDRSADLPSLARWFETLLRHADRGGKTAVFGCVRTVLRLDWFRHHCPGIHILIQRDPRRQFVSCLTQAVNGNKYFLERGPVILAHNPHDPAFAPLRRLLELPETEHGDIPEEEFRRRAWTTDWTRLYMVFFALHRLADLTRHADSIDLVIDIDRVSSDPAARAAAEGAIEDLTGAPLSLADCRVERYDKHLRWSGPFFAELETRAAPLIDAVLLAAGGHG